jgi:hypothetical protein
MVRKLGFLILTLSLAGSMSLPTWAANDVDQPHMQAALQHIAQAQKELEAAEQNKGGHRGKALEHLNAAKAEVEAGIKYADAHPDEPKRKVLKPLHFGAAFFLPAHARYNQVCFKLSSARWSRKKIRSRAFSTA